MPSGKTLAARPLPGMSYNGVNLTSQPTVYNAPKPGGSIADAIANAQTGQNAANVANNTRYNQGLGVLTSGYANSQGQIASALKDTNNLGSKQLKDIGIQEQAGHASTQQSAINRGIGNTTILDSLQQGVTKTADSARLDTRDMVAKNRAAINLQGAQNTNQGANSIAGFIGARNDNAPSLSEYAGLVNGAAQLNNNPTRNTATITKGSINDPINFGSGAGGGVQVPAGGGGALGSQTTTASGAGLGGGAGSFQFGSGGGGGGGGGGSSSATGGYYSGGGAVSQALNSSTAPVTGGSNFSPGMASQGMPQGSISITPSVQNLDVPNPNQQATKAPCRKWNYIYDSGIDPSNPQFC